jgi:hypothetical protein
MKFVSFFNVYVLQFIEGHTLFICIQCYVLPLLNKQTLQNV